MIDTRVYVRGRPGRRENLSLQSFLWDDKQTAPPETERSADLAFRAPGCGRLVSQQASMADLILD